jgi:putative FmdB family regulatory protein
MPTYGYECTECGHTFEEFQSIKAEPLRECPKCKGGVKRQLGAGAGFIFKGSGFYITDYARSKEYKEKAKSESPSSGANAGTGSGSGTGSGTSASGSKASEGSKSTSSAPATSSET